MTTEAKRMQLCSDIITTAIEGGIGYWSECDQYQYEYDGEIRVCVGPRQDDRGACAHIVTIVDPPWEAHWITPEVVSLGMSRVARGDIPVRLDLRKAVMAAHCDPDDCGALDADAADVIVQAGLFGEVVYG